ncbi:hypothetical protein [Pedobacter nyackensis]|uniref:hypothetical protein n=1 Tax=Pedobacter nyackensis TaxID=475255 RepID=UPI00292DDDF8|nr:hypothetical protein [Pedobacter nyackensis]
MDELTKIPGDTNYRNVYLSDLRQVLNIYVETETYQVPEKHSLPAKKLTEQFGLPLAIVESKDELIGFASAKMNDLKKVEFTSYYKKGISKTEIQPILEQLAQSTFNATFKSQPQPEKKLEYAAQKLAAWLNKCL